MTKDAILAMQNQLCESRHASLASLNVADGAPYCSLVAAAMSKAGYPLLLLSELAWHTHNLNHDPRGSLLFTDFAETGDVLAGSRFTVLGQFIRVEKHAHRAHYLKQLPAAETYIDFSDFHFWQLSPHLVHQVAGFGRIHTFNAEDVFPVAPRGLS